MNQGIYGLIPESLSSQSLNSCLFLSRAIPVGARIVQYGQNGTGAGDILQSISPVNPV